MLKAAGGWSGLTTTLPETHFTVTGAKGILPALGLFFPTFFLLLGESGMYQKFMSAKSAIDARKAVIGMIIGVVIVETVLDSVAVFGAGLYWNDPAYASDGENYKALTEAIILQVGRHDLPLIAAAIATFVRDLAGDLGPPMVGTVGAVDLHPNLVNVVAARAVLTVDLRHTDDDVLAKAEGALREHLEVLAAAEPLCRSGAKVLLLDRLESPGQKACAGGLTREAMAFDVVSEHEGRVVKLIGDEVMFRADSPDAACDVAADLVEAVREDPTLPPLRVGIAYGNVLSREGDFYGPIVNVAARVAKLASLNGIVVTIETIDALERPDRFAVEPLGVVEIRGVAEQNMISMAAGLSQEGFIPFPCTFDAFCRRFMDQLYISVAYARNNVKVLGAYVGLFTGKAGAAFEIKESGVHIDVGFQYSFTGKGNFFDQTGWWLSPYVGVLVRRR